MYTDEARCRGQLNGGMLNELYNEQQCGHNSEYIDTRRTFNGGR